MTNSPAFTEFGFDPRIVTSVARLGFEQATPIQAATFGPLLEGHDVIGRARTGSGKTAAFGLPLLSRLADGKPGTRAIILCPTRELALQVTDAMRDYARDVSGLRIATIYGGTPYPPQIKALKSGVSIVVGTPGRVLDHMQRKTLKLDSIEWLVLDEADEMLRMGFIDDVKVVLDAIPDERQIALFSATMPPTIQQVAKQYLSNPQVIQVEKASLTVDHIKQFSILVPQRHKTEALARVLDGLVTGPTLVFARTRAGCAETADTLAKMGLAVDALHGDLSQGARERVLDRFRARGLEIVIATDVAARGLDVDHITHVINYDIPTEIETYVHRIGRTGRAGREGTAVSFVTPRERQRFARLQRTLKASIDYTLVPSDLAIARHQQGRLRRAIGSCLTQDLDNAQAWVNDFLAETGLPASEVAAAAIQLLAEERNIPLTSLPEEPVARQRPKNEASQSSGEEPEREPRKKPRKKPRLGSGAGKRAGKKGAGKRKPGKGAAKAGKSAKPKRAGKKKDARKPRKKAVNKPTPQP
jgi:ATP-dependent RNA helicase DeaD